MTYRDRVLGSLLAGAVGDALGGPIEFLSIDDIRGHFGPKGPAELKHDHRGDGHITDDTQMTLFTLEALIRAHVAGRTGGAGDPVDPLQHAYQRWLHTQGMDWQRAAGEFAKHDKPDGWLISHEKLFRRRAPGNTCLTALRSVAAGGERGSLTHKLNDSKGCGGVMRAAPVALWPGELSTIFEIGAKSGALTHSHPSGYLSAGALAVIMRCVFDGADLAAAIGTARAELVGWDGYQEQADALDLAIVLAARGRPTPESIESELGGGWVGEEALAIAVYAALAAEDLADGIMLAANHSGDSDSTAAICGNLLGGVHGVAAIPEKWLADLELRDVIEQLTLDAIAEFGDQPPTEPGWYDRYPGW